MVGRWTDRQILSFHSNSVKRYHKPWCTHENRIRELKFCKVTQLEKDSWQTGSGGGGTESEARALSAVSGQVPKEPWLCQGKAKVTGLGSSPIQSSSPSQGLLIHPVLQTQLGVQLQPYLFIKHCLAIPTYFSLFRTPPLQNSWLLGSVNLR